MEQTIRQLKREIEQADAILIGAGAGLSTSAGFTYTGKRFEEIVCRMVKEQKDMRVPTELIPYCPICGAPMSMNLRVDGR